MCVDVGVVMGQLGVFGNVVLRLIRKSDLANFSSTYAICTKTIVHTHAHTRAYTHTRIHTHTHTQTHTHIPTHVHTHANTCAHTHARAHTVNLIASCVLHL